MSTSSSRMNARGHEQAHASEPAPLSQPATLSRDAREPRSARVAADDGRVSPAVARLEPWVSWSLAGYTAWVALLSFPDVPVLWLFVLYAGVLGKWCQMYPSRRQGRMFVHGALLVFGAYFLHTHADDRLGGPGGVFFFWVAIAALAYAFMLRPRWATGMAVLATAEFIMSHAMNGTLGAAAVAQSGFLMLFPLALAMPFGEALRKPDRLLEQTRVDTSTGLLNRLGVLSHGDELLHACQREKRPLTVAVFGCEDLLALRDVYGRRIGRKALELLVGKFGAIAGSRGLVARTGSTEFSLVLPGLTRDKAIQAIARQLGNPLRLEFDVGGEEIVIAPVVVLEAARANEASIEGLHTELTADLHSILANARQEEAGMRPVPGAVAVPAATPATDPVVARAMSAAADAGPASRPAPVSVLPTMPVALGARS